MFHGLDTYADVYLNDSLILEADNMFRTWRVDVTALLKSSNPLRIYFHSPIKRDVEKWNSLPQKYHAINDQSENGGIFDRRVSVFARKAGYHYGWDWGPRLVTSGIWRPIELVTNTGVLIDDVYTRQQTTAKLARLSQTVAINSTGDRQAVVSVCLKDTDKPLASKRVDLKAGRNEVTLDFQIKNPRLWWTNGLGEPHLYTFTTAVETDEQRIVEDQRIGLRSLRVLAEKDAEGREFCFELNGERVFMKGPTTYNVHRARFYSEYGMQSFPEFESVKAFCPDPQQWDIHSDVMMAHQRGGSFANSRIEGYLESEYVKPDDFADLLYVGQLMQGDAMKTAVEAHRRDKGHCWGTLIWQINDCWPKDFGVAADGTPTVTLTADAFVCGVFLSIPGVVNPFADNYLDLRPGQSVTIGVRNGVASSQLSSRLVLNSLNALGK